MFLSAWLWDSIEHVFVCWAIFRNNHPKIVKINNLTFKFSRKYMAKFLSVYSKNVKSKNLNFTKKYSSKNLALRGKCIVTFLPTLKIFFSAKKRFWKTTSRIISQNLGGFQGKCLWRSSVLAKALSLRLAVILVMILNYDFAKTLQSRIQNPMEHQRWNIWRK